ncbi:MAG: hypothetical protein AB1486_34060, partial [Planctomycetota bacterium]
FDPHLLEVVVDPDDLQPDELSEHNNAASCPLPYELHPVAIALGSGDALRVEYSIGARNAGGVAPWARPRTRLRRRTSATALWGRPSTPTWSASSAASN